MIAPIIRNEPTGEQELSKLPDQIADAWATGLINIQKMCLPHRKLNAES